MARGVFSTANYFTHSGFTATAGQKVALSAWVKVAAGTATQVMLGVRNGDSGAGNWCSMRIEDVLTNSFAQFVYDSLGGGNGSFVYSTTAIDDNTWRHIFCYYNGTRVRIYVNGVFEAQNLLDIAGAALTTTNTWAIGRRSDFSSEAWSGYLAEVAMWKGRTFDENDIAALGKGYSPLFFLNGMEMYYTLLPNEKLDLRNSRNPTEQGTVGTLDHPPIIYPGFEHIKFETATAQATYIALRMQMGMGL